MRTDGKTHARRLRKLRVRRVDLVAAGANRGAYITLAKSADDPIPPIIPIDPPKIIEQEQTMTLAEEIAALSEDEQTAVAQYVTDLDAALGVERAKTQEALAALAKAQSDDDDADDDVLKNADPALVERITKAEAAAAEATEKADAVMKAERERVFKARASQMVKLTGGDDGASKLGAILNKAEALLDEADYAELERTLVAADTQLSEGADLLKSLGSDGGDGGGEFVEAVKARAAELVKDGVDEIEALRTARRENSDAADYFDRTSNGTR